MYNSSTYGVKVIYEHIQHLMYSTATALSAPRVPTAETYCEDQDHWETTGVTTEKYQQIDNSPVQSHLISETAVTVV